MAGTTIGSSAGLELDPEVEARRLTAARRLGLLGPGADHGFERVTALAARSFAAPLAFVTVVHADRVRFTSRHGALGQTDGPRTSGLCASAVLQDDVWVVADTAVDPLVADDPLVAGPTAVRAYAGTPLITADGLNVGVLGVADTEPRDFSAEQLATLQDLAAIVVDELELRCAARTTLEQETELRRQAEELAGALQASLLPPRPPALSGMELATRYRAGGQSPVGGDFFDVFRLGTNDWGVALGDVCGRGARAAALTALARWTIRAAAVRSFAPATVLADLNAALLADEGAQADDHFCSAVFARVELDTCGAWVTLASAGHPRPIVVRRAGWIDVRGHVALPLGMFEDAAPADDRVGLGPGDALVLLTDGITETRGPDGDLFGDEQLLDVLLSCAGRTAEEVADRVMGAARSFGAGELRDDVAILVVRVPEDALDDPLGRVARATGVPADRLRLPGYPLSDVQPDVWHQPPDPPREARIRLAPEPASVPALRRLLGRLLASWRLDALVGGDVDLMASELATNSILHAATELTVIVRYLGAVVRVEVGDGSSEAPLPRDAEDDDLDGRGLLIVDTLATAWGVVRTYHGKRVWFEVAAPA